MSSISVNTITDASGGSTTSINGFTPSVSNMAGRNRIINGDMRIDQRNAGASVAASPSANTSTWGVDRWAVFASVGSKFTMQQNAGLVTPPNGFKNYQGVTSSSAYTVAAGETIQLYHNVEGFNVADLAWGTANAQAITVSFWVRSSLTGNFGGAVTNEAQNRSYPFLFAISAANTWEQKTLTIPGDTAGTWNTNNGRGITLIFDMGSGATFKGTAGAWAGSAYYSATGATSVVGTAGATFFITGVQLEAGSVATPFEHRQYGQELALCQRYFYSIRNYMGQGSPYNAEATGANGWSNGGTNCYRMKANHPVVMRATPTFTYANVDLWDGNQVAVTSVLNNNSSIYARSIDYNLAGSLAGVGRLTSEFVMPSGFVACSAEL